MHSSLDLVVSSAVSVGYRVPFVLRFWPQVSQVAQVGNPLSQTILDDNTPLLRTDKITHRPVLLPRKIFLSSLFAFRLQTYSCTPLRQRICELCKIHRTTRKSYVSTNFNGLTRILRHGATKNFRRNLTLNGYSNFTRRLK